MSLHLTPEILEANYELLRTTLPFRRWKLPHADDLEFRILVTKERLGHFRAAADGVHEMAISNSWVNTLAELTPVMGHEMIHLYQHKLGKRDTHGAFFNRMARLVCKHHDFNLETFV